MSPRHPYADAPAEYWLSDDGMDGARRVVADAVEALAAAFAPALDATHGEALAIGGWRTALGPYLWSLASYAFDRAAEPPATQPVALAPGALSWSCREFINRMVYETGLRPWLDAALARPEAVLPAVAAQRFDVARGKGGRRHPMVEGLRGALLFWEGMAPVVHYGAPFSARESVRLALHSRTRIRRARFLERPSALRWDGAQRQALQARIVPPHGSVLARDVLPVAVALLPTAFLEQYAEVREAAQRALESGCRVAVSALGAERSPAFAVFCAKLRARGGKVVGMQHGGYYGQTEATWYEVLEHQNADVYGTWGYQHEANEQPLPAPRLGQLPAVKPRFAGDGRYLWCLSANLPMPNVIARVPHFRRHAELNARCIEAARESVAGTDIRLSLRPYPGVLKDPLVEPWTAAFPGMEVGHAGGKSLVEHGALHDLVVFNYPGATGLLECLAAGYPCVTYCPDDIVPIRPEAQADFDDFAAAGLYAPDAGALRQSLHEFRREGAAWWEQEARVEARRRFTRKYAWREPDALQRWSAFLLGLLG